MTGPYAYIQPMVASDNALQDTHAIINARHVVWLLSHTTTCTGCRWVWSNRLQSQSLETQLPYLHRERKHFTTHLKPVLRYSKVLMTHVKAKNLLPEEQKALSRGRRGCLDALTMDAAIAREAQVDKRDLTVAWIDTARPMTWSHTTGSKGH